ncbi:MAG UNVERIFIED_CONTAM: hypothetical protein LVR29_34180 [Microcystis novacekii LVE1205-3]
MVVSSRSSGDSSRSSGDRRQETGFGGWGFGVLGFQFNFPTSHQFIIHRFPLPLHPAPHTPHPTPHFPITPSPHHPDTPPNSRYFARLLPFYSLR